MMYFSLGRLSPFNGKTALCPIVFEITRTYLSNEISVVKLLLWKDLTCLPMNILPTRIHWQVITLLG